MTLHMHPPSPQPFNIPVSQVDLASQDSAEVDNFADPRGSPSKSRASSDSAYFDAASEVGSANSDNLAESIGGHSDCTGLEKSAFERDLAEWEKQLESEHEARLRAETAAESTGLQVSGLKDDVKRLEKEVKRLETELKQGSRERLEAPSKNDPDSLAIEPAVARLVATALTRAICSNEADVRWGEDKKRLLEQLHRSSMMESIMAKYQRQENQQQEALGSAWMQTLGGVSCVGLGALSVIVFLKYANP